MYDLPPPPYSAGQVRTCEAARAAASHSTRGAPVRSKRRAASMTTQLRRQVGRDPVADLVAERGLVQGVAEVHGAMLLRVRPPSTVSGSLGVPTGFNPARCTSDYDRRPERPRFAGPTRGGKRMAGSTSDQSGARARPVPARGSASCRPSRRRRLQPSQPRDGGRAGGGEPATRGAGAGARRDQGGDRRAGRDARARARSSSVAGGHLLIEGVLGLAKTLTIKTTAAVLGGSFRRVQFTPDPVPLDLVGTRVYRPGLGIFDAGASAPWSATSSSTRSTGRPRRCSRRSSR